MSKPTQEDRERGRGVVLLLQNSVSWGETIAQALADERERVAERVQAELDKGGSYRVIDRVFAAIRAGDTP